MVSLIVGRTRKVNFYLLLPSCYSDVCLDIYGADNWGDYTVIKVSRGCKLGSGFCPVRIPSEYIEKISGGYEICEFKQFNISAVSHKIF